ncbi:MAG: MerR family transcriptional regulator [Candidatus Omnitrophota bacterium]
MKEDKISNVYLIKDLAQLSGYSVHTVKFYLKIGLIKEVSRSPQTRYRYFDDTTLKALERIHALRKENWPIKRIKDELL